MLIETYQSRLVLDTLRSGRVYHAEKSVNYGREYGALIDMLGLHCKCPVFGVLKFHRKCADGRGASSILLELDVPRDKVWLTEFSVWADFMYMQHDSTSRDYRRLSATAASTVSQQDLDELIRNLKHQRHPLAYRVPQVVLEEIQPQWVKFYKNGRKGMKQKL